ncbi:MAG TPA: glycoside hydrolase family 57 protein [Candidatus Eisenbacteria bacterium]|nr:glycoside hydrolase family 57 protein [Candidatus Eisenbacteria bacterium]
MAAPSVLLALVWHMHQPDYRDPTTRSALLPWVRLHATKDYRDMVEALRPYRRVHCTFNLTPVLLDQLEDLAGGGGDAWLDLARKPARSLSRSDQASLLQNFFAANQERMVEPAPRYRELSIAARRSAGDASGWSEQDWRDLQTWFHLAWVDPAYASVEPVRSLRAKGKGFTEEEKQALLDWGVAHCGTVAFAYKASADSGQIELSASAHNHPILPLLIDSDAPRESSETIALPKSPFRAPDDAAAQIRRARESHARRFGAPPRGTWPPEGAVNDAALALLAQSGFAWAASDESVLARALRATEGASPPWPAALYRPYRVETEHGSIAMVFRDRRISDAIGFVYKQWDPVRAAADFMERVRSAGRAAAEQGIGPALVTVLLDGENCWEAYAEDGRPFLNALYGALEQDPTIEAVTVSEALARVPPAATLGRVPVGSWIRDDLAIWIGHPEKNAAWDELRNARAALVGRGAKAPASAWESLHAAEASDWFWWYGDDHASEQKDVLDALFRAHVRCVYELSGAPAPDSLARTLRRESPGSAEAIPFVQPNVDGRETDYFEWRGAARYDAAASGDAMHRTAASIGEVRYGFGGDALCVRVEWSSGVDLAGVALRFESEGNERSATLSLDAADRGVPSWSDAGDGAGDAGSYALGAILEARLPLGRWRVGGAGDTLAWRIVLVRNGAVEESAPGKGWFRTPMPPANPDLLLWSAT